MSETEERRRQRCVNCSALSPEASTSYTLISVKHSWRMVLSIGADGKKHPQWYCPRCWEQRRRQSAP